MNPSATAKPSAVPALNASQNCHGDWEPNDSNEGTRRPKDPRPLSQHRVAVAKRDEIATGAIPRDTDDSERCYGQHEGDNQPNKSTDQQQPWQGAAELGDMLGNERPLFYLAIRHFVTDSSTGKL